MVMNLKFFKYASNSGQSQSVGDCSVVTSLRYKERHKHYCACSMHGTHFTSLERPL